MPELPDVEGFRRYLARHAQGQRIVRVDAPDRELVRNRSERAFESGPVCSHGPATKHLGTATTV